MRLFWSALALLLAVSLVPAAGRMSYTAMMPNGANVPGVLALGHLNPKGAGERNAFGYDFAKNDYTWDDALCLKDSDGDGEPNGMELGDPCCKWRIGEQRPLPLNVGSTLSHPSDKNWTSGFSFDWQNAGITGESLEALLEKLQAAGGARARAAIYDAAGFPCLAFGGEDDDTPDDIFSLAKRDTGQAVLALVLAAMYVWLLFRPVGGVMDVSRKFCTLPSGLTVVCAVVYTELESGLLHLTADNPMFNDYPGFGSLAVGFQSHHDDPAGISHLGWFVFLSKINIGVILLLVFAIIVQCRANDKNKLGVYCATLFSWTTLPMMYLMMATHRWTHCPPQDVPSIVRLLQDAGILLTIDNHNVHHSNYSLNFPLLTGWSSFAFNFVSGYIMGPRNGWWMLVFVAFSLGAPTFMFFAPTYLESVFGEPEFDNDGEQDARFEASAGSEGAELLELGAAPCSADAATGKSDNEHLPMLEMWLGGKKKVRALSALACVWITIATLNTIGFVFFALHPILMGIGCIGLMTEGMLAYHHTLKSASLASKAQDRIMHRRVQSAAAGCIALSVVVVLIHKMNKGVPILGGAGGPSLHEMLGITTVVGIIVQVCVGIYKVKSQKPVHKWHGAFGVAVYILSFVAVASGVVDAFRDTSAILVVVVLVTIVILTTRLRRQLARAGQETSPQV